MTEPTPLTEQAPAPRPARRGPLPRALVLAVAVVVAGVLALVAVTMLKPSDGSPGAMLKAAHLAANAGRYAEADKHLSSTVLRTLGGRQADLRTLWDQSTHHRHIQRIDILSTTVTGDDALVRYQTTFDDGQRLTSTTHMLREQGTWKEGFDQE